MSTIRVSIVGLQLDPDNGSGIVLLGDGPLPTKVLPIFIGLPEAAAIALGAQGVVVPRPGTHDLLLAALESVGATLTEVCVVALREGTFLAELRIDAATGRRQVDARPSDAIALAVRCQAPVLVDADLFDVAGVPVLVEADEPLPEAEIDRIVAEFHRLLEAAEPEDFTEPEDFPEPGETP